MSTKAPYLMSNLPFFDANKMHTSLELFPIQNNETLNKKFICYFKSRNFIVNEEKMYHQITYFIDIIVNFLLEEGTIKLLWLIIK